MKERVHFLTVLLTAFLIIAKKSLLIFACPGMKSACLFACFKRHHVYTPVDL